MIFKLVDSDSWAAACRTGQYSGSPDDLRDGYIHLSSPGQVRATADKYFNGVLNLLLVAFDEAALGPALVWELSRGGALFPHLYAPLPTALALWEKPVPLDADGKPILSEESIAC